MTPLCHNANNRLGEGVIHPSSGTSVFYAGIIGQGLKPKNKKNTVSKVGVI